MRGMLRRLFTVASALSLVLCAAAVTLWGASFGSRGLIRFCSSTPCPDFDLVQEWYLCSSAGGVSISHQVNEFAKGDGIKEAGLSFSRSKGPTYPFFGTRSLIPGKDRLSLWQKLGFEYGYSSEGTPPSIVREVIFPWWLCAFLLAVLPALWLSHFAKRRRHHRRSRGRCPRCAYDLRASRDRCPECGTPISVEQNSAAIPD